MCDTGLAYGCGDKGESGVGTVFYASKSSFACGENMASSCHYLEVAPNGWNGTPVKCPSIKNCTTTDFGSTDGRMTAYLYCSGEGQASSIPDASGTAIGTGFTNTSEMLIMCNPGDAAGLVRAYSGGGQTDWSVPSKDELNALFYYGGRDAIGGFDSWYYWSSSESSDHQATSQWFHDGSHDFYRKSGWQGIRPTRAF